ncbi:Os01g0678050 [Oryza sativa Japonica Group]|uniref:Os01g0678050 protein n=1 Tax=Oryza sativa subsp. japonica TaxID=39947 RepID=A0A0N7KDI0_ORYSJ|nr:hypothetical protein EE612_004975 [Oryza sativa]BAS73673.1 Os01g0678050 [Oryza sativa Japonica Group]
MVIDVAGGTSGFFLVWRICKMVKTQDNVVDSTSMMLSMSILDIASKSCSVYIPYKVISIFSKKRRSFFSLKLLIAPTPCPCVFASREENCTVIKTRQSVELFISRQPIMHKVPLLRSYIPSAEIRRS